MSKMTTRMAVASAVSAAIAFSGGAAMAHERPNTGTKASQSRHHAHKGEDRKGKTLKVTRAKALKEVDSKVKATDRVKGWLSRHDLGEIDDTLVASVAADRQALTDYRALIQSADEVSDLGPVMRSVSAYQPERYMPAYTALAQVEDLADDVAEAAEDYTKFDDHLDEVEEEGEDVTDDRATLDDGAESLQKATDALRDAAVAASSVRATTPAKSAAALLKTAKGKHKEARGHLRDARGVLDDLNGPAES